MIKWGSAKAVGSWQHNYFENSLLEEVMKEGGDLIYFYVTYEPTTDIFSNSEWVSKQ